MSQDSNVTPPVCLAAFTAAGIAKSPPIATSFEAWKISKGLYIVPLLFAYTQLVSGDFFAVMQIGAFSLFGMYAFSAIIQRFSEGPLAVWAYPILVASAAACFYSLELLLNIIGAFWALPRLSFTAVEGLHKAR